jgi:hypothetical protein
MIQSLSTVADALCADGIMMLFVRPSRHSTRLMFR